MSNNDVKKAKKSYPNPDKEFEELLKNKTIQEQMLLSRAFKLGELSGYLKMLDEDKDDRDSSSKSN